MMKTWVKYTLISAISVAVIGGTTFGVQSWAFSKGVKEIEAGGPADLEKGLGHLKMAHALGNRSAACEIGVYFLRTKNQNTAIEWFRKAAERGDARAQMELGRDYIYGILGAPQDISEGMKLYQKAADQGSAEAQRWLGYYYLRGQIVPQNYTEAVKWYQKAADQGDAEAQSQLGSFYFDGQVTPQSYSQALQWYQKAADQGDAAGQCGLGDCYHFGKGAPQSDTEAIKWYQKAAEQGHAGCQYMVGMGYTQGKGVPQNAFEAVKWMQKAAEQGEDRSQYRLGLYTLEGWGTSRNISNAANWLKKSAAQGNEEARNLLTKLMTTGMLERLQTQDTPITVDGLAVVNDSGYPRIRGTVRNTNSRPMDAYVEIDLLRADGVVVEQFSKNCYQVSPGGGQLIDIAIAPYHANAHVRLRKIEWR